MIETRKNKCGDLIRQTAIFDPNSAGARQFRRTSWEFPFGSDRRICAFFASKIRFLRRLYIPAQLSKGRFMRNPTLPALFTINQFVDWSGLGRTKTYELLSSGALAAVKIGRRTLIRTDSAEAWLAAQTPYGDASGTEG